MLISMICSTASTSRHQKLYVLAQATGWGAFTLAYIALAQLNKGISLDDTCVFVATNIVGLLISHVFRCWIHRRGWKQLGWGALLPRVVVATLVISLIWSAVTWPLYVYLGSQYEAMRLPKTVLFAYSVMNGIWVYGLWLLLYFAYHMADRYHRSELDRAQLAAAVKEAELRALKSQVNPHFIFNALNSLRALIGEDPVRARQAVTQMANLLRYSLQSGQLETVPFEEELRIVNDYLALEQVRHEERLRLRLDVEPDTLQLAVPPMLLQTLVENAVKYGITRRPDGGEIAIIARRDRQGLLLQVVNPGEMSPTGESGQEAGSTGVGLHNAAERLRLLCGEEAALELRAGAGGTVVTEARIPQPGFKTPALAAV